MDNESLILQQLHDIHEGVGELKVDMAEVKAFQATHLEKLTNHEQRLQMAERKVQDLEVKTSGNKIVIGIAGFFAGACVIGGVNYFFTTVLPGAM